MWNRNANEQSLYHGTTCRSECCPIAKTYIPCTHRTTTLSKSVWYDHNYMLTRMAESHQSKVYLYIWLWPIDDECDQMWYNSVHVYLYMEGINYSLSPIFWASSNQFWLTPSTKTFYLFLGSISWLHNNNTLR